MALSLVSPAFRHGLNLFGQGLWHGLNVVLVQWLWNQMLDNGVFWQVVGLASSIEGGFLGIICIANHKLNLGIPLVAAALILGIFLIGLMN